MIWNRVLRPMGCSRVRVIRGGTGGYKIASRNEDDRFPEVEEQRVVRVLTVAHPNLLLDLIHHTPAAAESLTWPFDFDVSRTEHVEVVRPRSGDAPEAIAGDGADGMFLLCGDTASEQSVPYADSEGQAGTCSWRAAWTCGCARTSGRA